jgi:hypothetical protein
MLSAIFARMENRTLEDDIASQQQKEAEQRDSHAVVGSLLNDVLEKIVQDSAKEEFNASGVLKGSTESLNNRKVSNLISDLINIQETKLNLYRKYRMS